MSAIEPATGMLTVVSDEEIAAVAQRQLPMVGATTIYTSVALFRRLCAASNVVLLKATPNDFATINQRQAVGWSDDRP